MRALIPALVAFSVWIIAHWIIWRVRRPTGQYVGLLALCLAVLIAFIVGFHAVPSSATGLGWLLPVTGLDYLSFIALYMALAMAYVTTYSAVQADSPTMSIVLRIEEAGSGGLTLEQIMDQLNDQVLVIPRLVDLVTGNLVRLDGGSYVIGPRGALLAKAHMLYRALLRMEKGG